MAPKAFYAGNLSDEFASEVVPVEYYIISIDLLSCIRDGTNHESICGLICRRLQLPMIFQLLNQSAGRILIGAKCSQSDVTINQLIKPHRPSPIHSGSTCALPLPRRPKLSWPCNLLVWPRRLWLLSWGVAKAKVRLMMMLQPARPN